MDKFSPLTSIPKVSVPNAPSKSDPNYSPLKKLIRLVKNLLSTPVIFIYHNCYNKKVKLEYFLAYFDQTYFFFMVPLDFKLGELHFDCAPRILSRENFILTVPPGF